MNHEYVFTPVLREEDDGRWSAWLETIPWCVTWGDTRDEALAELQDAASVTVGYLLSKGEEIPVADTPPVVVAV